ncbi:MAG: hypothetical protein R3A46_14725 [Thermomicrobiales bacterium]
MRSANAALPATNAAASAPGAADTYRQLLDALSAELGHPSKSVAALANPGATGAAFDTMTTGDPSAHAWRRPTLAL